jgi:hypothetical protein
MDRLTITMIGLAVGTALLVGSPTSSSAQCATCTVQQECEQGDDGDHCDIHFHDGEQWCQWHGACEPEITMIPDLSSHAVFASSNRIAGSLTSVQPPAQLALVTDCEGSSVVWLEPHPIDEAAREPPRQAVAPGVGDR